MHISLAFEGYAEKIANTPYACSFHKTDKHPFKVTVSLATRYTF